MALRECLSRVLKGYLKASNEAVAQHPMANFIRRELPETIAAIVDSHGRLLVKGSAGQGTWGRGPWVVSLIDSSPRVLKVGSTRSIFFVRTCVAYISV